MSYGNERRQEQTNLYSETQRTRLEAFAQCRIDLIRSTHWKCYAPWSVPRRVVGNEFFIFVMDGRLAVETPAGKRVLSQGEFLYSAPGEFHSFGFTGKLQYVEHILIHCRVQMPGQLLPAPFFRSPFMQLPHPDAFLDRLRQLPYLWETWSPAAQGCAYALLKGLFMELCTDEALAIPLRTCKDSRVASALTFMHEHLADELVVEDIAARVELSEVHFRRRFKRETQRSPLAALTDMRLQRACRLLHDTQDKVHEIAHACGFRNADYFCRLFKQKYFCTPTTYRLMGSLDAGR